MVYWGMARATSDKRSEEFVREAAKRKNSVTERERLYIESLEASVTHDALRDRGDDYERRDREYRKVLESIIVKYPDGSPKPIMAAAGTIAPSCATTAARSTIRIGSTQGRNSTFLRADDRCGAGPSRRLLEAA